MKRAIGSVDSEACWGETLGEVGKGRLTGPSPISHKAMAPTPLTPRFAIREARSDGPKFRLIGDCRAIGANDIVSIEDTDAPHTLDTCLSLAMVYKRTCPGIRLFVSAVYFARDYKHAPPSAKPE